MCGVCVWRGEERVEGDLETLPYSSPEQQLILVLGLSA